MATARKITTNRGKKVPQKRGPTATQKVAADGIKTSRDFARFMSAMMTDLISARMSPAIANAACNAGANLLKVTEMQMKYGAGPHTKTELVLAETRSPDIDA